MIRRALGAFLLAAIIAAPGIARAGCHTGETPGWSDVDTLEITRCQITNKEYPCYDAVLAQGSGDTIEAYVVAKRLNGSSGRFLVEPQGAGGSWSAVIGQVSRADFMNLELLQPPRNDKSAIVVIVDGARDQIAVKRCSRWTAVSRSAVGYQKDGAYERFQTLLDTLDGVVEHLPLKPDERSKKPVEFWDVERHFLI